MEKLIITLTHRAYIFYKQEVLILYIMNHIYIIHLNSFKINIILTFNNLVNYNTCEFMFKANNNNFSTKSNSYPIRDINEFNIPSSKLNICSHCLIFY